MWPTLNPFLGSRTTSFVQDNPFLAIKGGRRPPVSHFLSEADVAQMYAAFAFAEAWGLTMDTTVTISWRLLGPEFEADVQKSLNRFLKAMRTWLAGYVGPITAVYVYVHEQGRVVGTHTHLALSLPQLPWTRRWFRRWLRTWVRNVAGGPRPRAVRTDCRANSPQPWQHWRPFHYMAKGFDQTAIVLRSKDLRVAPDRFLGDLLAYPWADPGAPAVGKRFGVSDSIGPGARAFGVPDVGNLHECARSQLANPYVDPFRLDARKYHPALREWRPGPFRSKYDMGARDVRKLYPADFLAIMDQGWARPPLGTSPDVASLETELASANARIWQLEEELMLERLTV